MTVSSMRPGTPNFAHHWLPGTKRGPGSQKLLRPISAAHCSGEKWECWWSCAVRIRHLGNACLLNVYAPTPTHSNQVFLYGICTHKLMFFLSARFNINFAHMHENVKLMLRLDLILSVHYFYLNRVRASSGLGTVPRASHLLPRHMADAFGGKYSFYPHFVGQKWRHCWGKQIGQFPKSGQTETKNHDYWLLNLRLLYHMDYRRPAPLFCWGKEAKHYFKECLNVSLALQ